jgi:hypothetical protein
MGIESPQSIDRKIQSLDDAFEALGRSFPGDVPLGEEIKRFRAWRDTVRSSLTSSFFPSTVAPEFDQWRNRYRVAFEQAQKAHPDVVATAPVPSAILDPKKPTDPWFWAILAASGAVGLVAIAKILK